MVDHEFYLWNFENIPGLTYKSGDSYSDVTTSEGIRGLSEELLRRIEEIPTSYPKTIRVLTRHPGSHIITDFSPPTKEQKREFEEFASKKLVNIIWD